MSTLRSFAALSLFVAVAGCSAETGGPGDAFEPQRDPNEPCSTLANVASPVEIVEEASEPPAPTGGAIADGTYVVTRAVRFTGPGGASGPSGKNVQMTVRIQGQDAESVFDGVGRRARIVVDGVNLRTTAICPSSAIDDAPFSASGDSLSLYLNDSKGTRVYSLTRI